MSKASFSGNYETSKLLIENGADVNRLDKWGMTPISSAASNGHLDIVRLLLKNGANVNTADKHGGTPLYYASAGGFHETVELLISKGANVNCKTDYKDETALIKAVQIEDVKTVKLLLENGVDSDAKTKDGKTASMAIL